MNRFINNSGNSAKIPYTEMASLLFMGNNWREVALFLYIFKTKKEEEEASAISERHYAL